MAVVDGSVWIARFLAAPATSRKLPKFEFVDTVVSVAVPVTFRLPLARGVPAVGLTRKFCQVNLHSTPLALGLVTVNVIWVADTDVIANDEPLLATLMLFPAFPPPLTRSILTVGAVPPISKTKLLGAFRMIVPVPTSPVTFSEYVGPVRLVKLPPVVSAEIALPPEAPVNWTEPLTEIPGLVFAVLLPSVTSLLVIVCEPVVPKVTLNVCVPATSAALAGNVAAASLDVMLTVSPIALTTFQFASTALIVTLNGPPTFCPIGVPLLPVAVPGPAVSPGTSNCSFVNAPGLTAIDALVLLAIPACVTSAAVTVALPTVLSVALKLFVPFTSAALAGIVALESLAVIAMVSFVPTTFQFASTAFTVTVNDVPAVCAVGVPVLPACVPGAAISPGSNS